MRIEEYHFGSITVEGETCSSDVIISPEGVNASWWRQRGHELCCEDLEPVWEARPEVLVIGTGSSGLMKVLPEADALMRKRCSEVHVLRTPQAWKRFNELAETGRRVVAALHLTC